MNLFELKDAKINLQELRDNEKFKDDASVKEALDNIDCEFNDKLDSVAYGISETGFYIEAIKSEIKRLQDLIKDHEALKSKLQNYIKAALAGLGGESGYKVRTTYHTFTVSKPRHDLLKFTRDFNLAALPDTYKTVKVFENKAAIKDALKAGERIDGAFLAETRSLRIK